MATAALLPASLPAPGQAATLPLYSVTPFTMLDFPGKTACILWFAGCNMRCGYCHNPQIVRSKGRGGIEQALSFLEKRRGLLDGVVLSGGEASAYPGLPALISRLKVMGYAVKLDTNGLHPDAIAHLLAAEALDYVALDYKAPPHRFRAVTGTSHYQRFSRTLGLLASQHRVPVEVRTTVHTGLLDEADIEAIIADLEKRGFTGTYAIQNFIHSDDRETLGKLPAQQRLLNTGRLPAATFPVILRNFPEAPARNGLLC